jgi:hypothetical protein
VVEENYIFRCFKPILIAKYNEMIKSRRIKRAGYVTRMGRRKMQIEFLCESQEGKDYEDDPGLIGA